MREKLINIIARCSCECTRRDWIIEMSEETDIECTESQCITCPIAKDCQAVSEIKESKEIKCLCFLS